MRRLIGCVGFVVSLGVATLGCSAGGSSSGSSQRGTAASTSDTNGAPHTGPVLTVQPEGTPGVLEAPAGTSPDEFQIESAYGTGTPAADGRFQVPVNRGERQLVFGTRNGRVQLLTLMNVPALDARISTRTTAATLTFLLGGLSSMPADRWDEAFDRVLADPTLPRLEAAVAATIGANQSVLFVDNQVLGDALTASAQSVAAGLQKAAKDSEVPTGVSGAEITQIHRVTPAIYRSGTLVDTQNSRVVNNRRRHVFTAVVPADRRPSVDDYQPVAPASEAGLADVTTTWKSYMSEGGFSFLPPSGTRIQGRQSAYKVVTVGSSLRTNAWPAKGTPERYVFSRAFAADLADLHIEALALALGIDLVDMGPGREVIVGSAGAAAAASMAIEDPIAQIGKGQWALIDHFADMLDLQVGATLKADLVARLTECIGGIAGSPVQGALRMVDLMGAGLRRVAVEDLPVLLSLEASDPQVVFTVDPTRTPYTNGLTIVLQWGKTPTDLDSHLVGPNGRNGLFHLDYTRAETASGSPVPGIAALDLDDQSSFGPETTTILEPPAGTFRFMVFDFSNGNTPMARALADSDAVVTVFKGSNPRPIASFEAPRQIGNLWTVFDYNAQTGQVSPIDVISAINGESQIRPTALGR